MAASLNLEDANSSAMLVASASSQVAAPAQIIAGFDRQPDASTVNANAFFLEASGGDSTFGDGNEITVAATSINVPGGNPRTAVFDLTGVVLADETYRADTRSDSSRRIYSFVCDGGLP